MSYELRADGTFCIRDYQRAKPFSNFLPGIAGLYGTPMWVFYVNRGQGVASFGTRNKDNAILEFFPANKAYLNVNTLGFRTFVKAARRGCKPKIYEAFKQGTACPQTMEIRSHEFQVEEACAEAGLKITVRYWTVPGESLAALAREVTFTNLGKDALEIEAADGLPMVNPYGMNEFFVKNMSRTIEAWMRAENFEKKSAFYRLKVDATDRPEVEIIKEGNFYFSFFRGSSGRTTEPLPPIADPAVLFGARLDFSEPEVFYTATFHFSGHKKPIENKTPCAFSAARATLGPGKTAQLVSFFGHASSAADLDRFAASARRAGYPEAKREENRLLVEAIKSRALTVSASPTYDLYSGQTFLDNVLRGGLPVRFDRRRGGAVKPSVFYVYSRKHGDLERDYNRFLVEPTYWSQGDGNYRDANQNRRNDVWFEPWVRDENIKTFLNHIQLDGFNPLVVKGVQFHVKRAAESLKILKRHFPSAPVLRRVEGFVRRPFDPGSICRFLEKNSTLKRERFADFFAEWSGCLEKEDRAEHGEGFWTDHWTYNLDLIESYFCIYPEDKADLLLTREDFTFYDNDHIVRPRSLKYIEKHPNAVRQYRSVCVDAEKSALLKQRGSHPHLVRTRGGRGDVYKTTLFVKLLCLLANKFASLDPEGTGVEMEADKPGWLDALNGLPGLLGSSVCESFELKRLAVFLTRALEDLEVDLQSEAQLPEELCAFIGKLRQALNEARGSRGATPLVFWQSASEAKERFRQETRLGLTGKLKRVKFAELKIFLEHVREKLDSGLEKACDFQSGYVPTYFENEVTRFRVRKPGGTIEPLAFRQKSLPLFLEGPVHAIKVETDPARRRRILRAVRESGLYDAKLGMYKVNAPLGDTSLEAGRACVFYPGWLENESVWLHMEYKFLLEMLRGGLDEEFFKDWKKALVPFQPAGRYGRSVLENSSFIVSSAFFDASLHGAGFVARLSGSTAEFLNMWLLMNVGKRPFILGHDRKLSLRFEPHLPAFLFTQAPVVRQWVDPEGRVSKISVPKDSFAFLFLGKTLVVYHNPKRLDTFGKIRVSVKKISLSNNRGAVFAEFKGDTVPSPYSAKVRDSVVPRIDIELG